MHSNHLADRINEKMTFEQCSPSLYLNVENFYYGLNEINYQGNPISTFQM